MSLTSSQVMPLRLLRRPRLEQPALADLGPGLKEGAGEQLLCGSLLLEPSPPESAAQSGPSDVGAAVCPVTLLLLWI